jgi:hypothetical protein
VFSVIGIFVKPTAGRERRSWSPIVLGPQIQQYLWLSMDRHSFEWMAFPSIIMLAIFIAATIALPFWRMHKRKRRR